MSVSVGWGVTIYHDSLSLIALWGFITIPYDVACIFLINSSSVLYCISGCCVYYEGGVLPSKVKNLFIISECPGG